MEEMTIGPGLGVIDEDGNTGYALVINGHSLVYALQPKLEKLFLDVGTQCKYLLLFLFGHLGNGRKKVFVCLFFYRQSGDLLQGDSPSEGHGRRLGQKI